MAFSPFAGFPDYLSKLHKATVKFAERRVQKEEEEKARKAAEAAEEEEKRKKDEEEKKKISNSQQQSPETWEAFFGGGPVLSNVPNERLNYLLNKLKLLGT